MHFAFNQVCSSGLLACLRHRAMGYKIPGLAESKRILVDDVGPDLFNMKQSKCKSTALKRSKKSRKRPRWLIQGRHLTCRGLSFWLQKSQLRDRKGLFFSPSTTVRWRTRICRPKEALFNGKNQRIQCSQVFLEVLSPPPFHFKQKNCMFCGWRCL